MLSARKELGLCITEYLYRGMHCSFDCVATATAGLLFEGYWKFFVINGSASTLRLWAVEVQFNVLRLGWSQTTSQATPEWVVTMATSSARFLIESL